MASAEESGTLSVGEQYLRLIFDPDRFGFRRVADRILMQSGLDYHGFVAFKRSSRFIYDYIFRYGLENRKLRRKLARDWGRGHCRDTKLTVPASATHALVFDHDRRLLVAVEKRVFVFSLERNGGGIELTFCGHQSRVSCLALEGSLAVSGDLNGMLVAWDWRSGAVVAEKQMFGRIEALRLKGGFLATGHISKSYDTGCISIRKFNLETDETPSPAPPPPPPPLPPPPQQGASSASVPDQNNSSSSSDSSSPSGNKKPKVSKSVSPTSPRRSPPATKFSLELPVHFSWFGLDLHPVSDLDFNSRYMAVLQWNVTFRGVDAGSVSVYRFASRDRVCNLSKAAGSTFSCCRFVPAKDREDLVLTGADDGSIRLWILPPSDPLNLGSGGPVPPQCLRVLALQHQQPILAAEPGPMGCRIISRDLAGDTVVWDVDRLLEERDDFDEEDCILVKKNTRSFTSHTAVAISNRWYVMSNLDTSVLCYDVWRGAAEELKQEAGN